jgi:hypothetical protein
LSGYCRREEGGACVGWARAEHLHAWGGLAEGRTEQRPRSIDLSTMMDCPTASSGVLAASQVPTPPPVQQMEYDTSIVPSSTDRMA